MTGKILDVSQIGAKPVTGRKELVGTLADALALDDPLRDQRPLRDDVDIECPENGHEWPEKQFSRFHSSLNKRRDHVPAIPTLDGRRDCTGENRTKALVLVNVVQAIHEQTWTSGP